MFQRMIMRMDITLCLLLLVFAYGCKTVPPAMSNGANAGQQKQAAPAEAHILAVILKASRTAGDTTVRFEVSSITKPQGRLKPGQNDNLGNDYTITFATEKKEPLATYHIADPLNSRMEWADEAGNLQTKRIEKTEEYISVRTNYVPEIKKIIIRKTTGGKEIVLPVKID